MLHRLNWWKHEKEIMKKKRIKAIGNESHLLNFFAPGAIDSLS